jgi:hypothetical protein
VPEWSIVVTVVIILGLCCAALTAGWCLCLTRHRSDRKRALDPPRIRR